ncbi:MAG TPA: hypothetical protein VFB12_15540 [Ktedonobacteraceae bacterium]|nr:hypothetical protein [Ktedonobacteraceae bacterium]
MDQRSIQRARRASAKQVPVDTSDLFDEEYDDVWPSRMPNSTRRYHSDVKTETGHAQADVQSSSQNGYFPSQPGRRNMVPPRRTAARMTGQASQSGRWHTASSSGNVDTDEILVRHSSELELQGSGGGPRFHWLVYVGMAMLIMLLGWIVLSGLTNWWQVTQDDWHYGRPRTFQVDAAVGHNDSSTNPSHFIALNLNRHVEIIEFPGGDSSKAKIYMGPVLLGQGQDLAPVTLNFKDVNGDGKLDMIVNVQGSHFVFINDNGAFRPQRPGENVQQP